MQLSPHGGVRGALHTGDIQLKPRATTVPTVCVTLVARRTQPGASWTLSPTPGEGEQVRVQPVEVGDEQAVRRALVDLEPAAGDELRGALPGEVDGGGRVL